MCGVGHTSITRWSREYQATGLRSPVSPGPSIIRQGLYQEVFRDLLIWGEAICKSRLEEGRSTRVVDFADAALENEAFRENLTTALVSLGSIVTERSERLLDFLRFTESGSTNNRQRNRIIMSCIA